MKTRLIAIAATALALGGCATTATPVDVTRFSRATDVLRGPVAAIADSAATLEQRSYETAVERELTRLGFEPRAATAARYVYAVDVTRDTRPAAPRRSPVTVGIGGGTGGYGGGVGLGASFGIGSRPRAEGVTRLSVRLVDRAGGQVVWEGRAEGSADVARLAAALFRDFPGESGRTISVP